MQLHDTNPQISFVELVWDIPSQGAELPALLNQSMEETQTK